MGGPFLGRRGNKVILTVQLREIGTRVSRREYLSAFQLHFGEWVNNVSPKLAQRPILDDNVFVVVLLRLVDVGIRISIVVFSSFWCDFLPFPVPIPWSIIDTEASSLEGTLGDAHPEISVRKVIDSTTGRYLDTSCRRRTSSHSFEASHSSLTSSQYRHIPRLSQPHPHHPSKGLYFDSALHQAVFLQR